jgi:hypothetical protein
LTSWAFRRYRIGFVGNGSVPTNRPERSDQTRPEQRLDRLTCICGPQWQHRPRVADELRQVIGGKLIVRDQQERLLDDERDWCEIGCGAVRWILGEQAAIWNWGKLKKGNEGLRQRNSPVPYVCTLWIYALVFMLTAPKNITKYSFDLKFILPTTQIYFFRTNSCPNGNIQQLTLNN